MGWPCDSCVSGWCDDPKCKLRGECQATFCCPPIDQYRMCSYGPDGLCKDPPCFKSCEIFINNHKKLKNNQSNRQ